MSVLLPIRGSIHQLMQGGSFSVCVLHHTKIINYLCMPRLGAGQMDNRTETGGSRVDFMPDVSTEGGANYA
jgi:hypothetical protein